MSNQVGEWLCCIACDIEASHALQLHLVRTLCMRTLHVYCVKYTQLKT